MENHAASPRRRDAIACCGLTLAWVAAIAWLGLDGEYPVSDDWAYAHTVRALLETGRFERLEWTWVPMISNAGLGWAFSQAFGFSYASLRLSSACMGWLGMLGVFALGRQLGAAPVWAGLAAALYAFSPLHLALSLTFMTDVAFAAFAVWALVCLARGLPRLAWGWLALGAVFAALASLSRQPGMGLFAVAFVVALVARPSWAGWLALGVAAVALFFVALEPERVRGALELNWYLRSILGEPRAAAFHLAHNAAVVLFTFGLLAFPLAAGVARARGARFAAPAAAAGAALLLTALASFALPVPPGIDWLFDLGIGPGSHLEPHAFWHLPRGAALAIAALAGASAGVALAELARGLIADRRARERAALWLAALYPALVVAALAIRQPFFDRYLIVVSAPLFALLARSLSAARGARVALVAVAALPVLWFALAGTHDFRAREGARAELLEELLAAGVAPQRIDGGPSFNGASNYGRFPAERGRFVVDDEYRVGFSPALAGYRVVRERPFRILLPPGGRGAARVFQRLGPFASSR